MIRVQADGLSVGTMNEKVTGDSKPQEGVVQIRNLMEAILAGAVDAQVDVAVRETTQSISADGDGDSASYNLK